MTMLNSCSKCGAKIDLGAKFCAECGAVIPHTKECPTCHAQVMSDAKFCPECGCGFARKELGGGGVAIGDKNIIAGDVVGKKDTYSVSGNATIVRNEDESKKLVKCSLCGKNMAVSESITCKSCGEIVCSECFDADIAACKKCSDRRRSKAIAAYQDAIINALEDGKIDAEDRKRLIVLQRELDLPAALAIQVEKELIKSRETPTALEDSCAVDKVNCDRAFALLYENGDYKQAAELLAPIVERRPSDEEVLSLYIAALAKYNPVYAKRFVESLNADILAGALALIDIELLHEDFTAAEKRIKSAKAIWPDSVLLKCREVIFLVAMCKVSDETSSLMMASEITRSIGEQTDSILKSWAYYSRKLVTKALGENTQKITRELCKEQGLLWDIVSQDEERCGAQYCIVDLSRGTHAAKYPVLYMNTASETGWGVEHKTELLVLRKIMPGKYRVGHVKGGPKGISTKHFVTLTHAYYIGVFPFTQRQWELVCGPRNFIFSKPECCAARPADNISFSELRGKGIGDRWPVTADVDSNSFLAAIRKKTGLIGLDLPTESQWEVACRAGCKSDFYDGHSISPDDGCNRAVVSKLGRFYGNQSIHDEDTLGDLKDDTICRAELGLDLGTSEVGSYLPNAWGLYDFIGNVNEWCLSPDFGGREGGIGIKLHNSVDAIDPIGGYADDPNTQHRRNVYDKEDRFSRVVRGGNCFVEDPSELTVWYRDNRYRGDCFGFRLAMTIDNKAVDDLAARRGVDVFDVPCDLIDDIRKAASVGNLHAEYFLAVINKDAEPSVFESECRRLCDLNLPIAGRALAQIELSRETDEGRARAIEIYRKNQALGDVESSVCLRRGGEFGSMIEAGVVSILKGFLSRYNHAASPRLFVGPELRERLAIFKRMVAYHFGWSDSDMPKRFWAVVAEDMSDEKLEDPWESNFVAFTSDGIVVIQRGAAEANGYSPGYITWVELAARGEIRIFGDNNQMLEFIPRLSVVSYVSCGHSDAVVGAYRKIVKFTRDNAKELLSQNNVKRYTKDELCHISNSDFEKLERSLASDNVEDNYSLGLCFLNGWGAHKDFERGLTCLGKASTLGHVAAKTAYEQYCRIGTGVIKQIYDCLVADTKKIGKRTYSRKELDLAYPSWRRAFADNAKRYYLENGDEIASNVFAALGDKALKDGIGVFFAADGVYSWMNEMHPSGRGSGYVSWPAFTRHCRLEQESCVVLEFPKVLVVSSAVGFRVGELAVILNSVADIAARNLFNKKEIKSPTTPVGTVEERKLPDEKRREAHQVEKPLKYEYASFGSNKVVDRAAIKKRMEERNREAGSQKRSATIGATVLMAVSYALAWTVAGFGKTLVMMLLFLVGAFWLARVTHDRGGKQWKFSAAILSTVSLFVLFIVAQISNLIH